MVAVREQNLRIVLSTASQQQAIFNGRSLSAMSSIEQDLRDTVAEVAAAAAKYNLSTPVGAMGINARLGWRATASPASLKRSAQMQRRWAAAT